ncbi:MAG: glycosyltransferase family 4 protein [Thermoplasmata archaeon]|nr:glycosyltransferase family 4 protein [Thermoplasmata archaeon]
MRGGIERHAAGLAEELRRRGHAASVIRPTQLRRADVADADWLVFDGVRRLTVLRHARRNGPGLVLFPHGSFLEEAQRRELRRTGAWSTSGAFLARAAFDASVGRRVFGRFDRWFVLTEGEGADVRRLLKVPPERISVLGLFLSREFLAASAASPRPTRVRPPYVCAVSRIAARKNFGSLLEAIDGAPYLFVLAGQDRGGLAALKRASRQFPGARWEYLGPVAEAEKVDLIRGSDAVVVPSIVEGVPTLALEALALGRRVLLAGLAYGPEGPGVVRCDPDPKSLRGGLDELRTRPLPEPVPPSTVEATTDRFLSELGGTRPLQ